MSRVYIFCEGKRDKLFLKKLIKEKKNLTTSEIELTKLDNLIRDGRFEGIALIECGGYDKLLKQAARRARDLALNPKTLPHASIIVVGDGDKVDTAEFKARVDSQIQKLRHKNRILDVSEEQDNFIVLKNSREGHTIRVQVLTIPDNLEKQLAYNVRRLAREEVKGQTDDRAIHYYCDLKYNCNEEEMMNNDNDVVGPLLDSSWARKIIESLEIAL